MNKKSAIKQLKEEGFKEVYVWEDKSSEVYKKHKHSHETKLIILKGKMEIKITDKKISAKKGTIIEIPKNTFHEAIIGSKGCTYVVGESK